MRRPHFSLLGGDLTHAGASPEVYQGLAGCNPEEKGVLLLCCQFTWGPREVRGGSKVRSCSSDAGDKQEHLISSLYQRCLQKGRGVPTTHPKVTNPSVVVFSL